MYEKSKENSINCQIWRLGLYTLYMSSRLSKIQYVRMLYYTGRFILVESLSYGWMISISCCYFFFLGNLTVCLIVLWFRTLARAGHPYLKFIVSQNLLFFNQRLIIYTWFKLFIGHNIFIKIENYMAKQISEVFKFKGLTTWWG